ncbi:hypothetical protein ACFQY4_13435 [Catellatospora bangladeshensis]|uniref:Uncharacterized protein n=1 Tax=Catellatospora bangladeshensis TaxID=310355 RepID=A0A8J3NLF7_9ACTN|nr:hypothetical protein [Catellatospora bangladeshensis]GIF84987.1 hypothetical protein Cba03nite_63360 [Catellatospora bangladeshensis]
MTVDVMAPRGGVMTDEVGTITGELTLEPKVETDGTVRLRVQYKGAEEWYTVTGAQIKVPDPADATAVDRAARHLLDRFSH